jgi:hypothetical protein
MHMLLPYHRSDYQKFPDEGKLLPALRAAGLKRGLYIFPFCTHKDMKSPAMIEKYKQGPVGMMTVFPSGPPAIKRVHRGATLTSGARRHHGQIPLNRLIHRMGSSMLCSTS